MESAWFWVITTNVTGAILGAIMVWHYEYRKGR